MPKTNAGGSAKKASDKKLDEAHSKEIESNLKDQQSIDEIPRLFAKACCLVTVGILRIILAATRQLGIQGFGNVIKKLEKIDRENPLADGSGRALVWIISFDPNRNASSLDDFKLLQECYRKLPAKTKAWLSSRAIVIVTPLNPGWNLKRIARGVDSKLAVSGDERFKAEAFFKSFETDGQANFEAVTAFLSVTDRDQLIYRGHRVADDNPEPVAFEQISESSNRDDIVLSACQAGRSFESGEIDSHAVLSLEKKKFAVYTFEEFANFKIK